jgi:outer membrane protein assembly factor BamB
MSRLFQPISAKPTFGILQKNNYASDYTKKLKLRQEFSYSIKNQTRNNLSNNQILDLKNCQLKDDIIFNKPYLDKTSLIAGLYSEENLENIVTLSDSSQTNTPSNITIDISNIPFYNYYNIDPNGLLFGNTPCGLNNYINFMQINEPNAKLSGPLQKCIKPCNLNEEQICKLVCSAPQVNNYPYQIGSPWPHIGGLYNTNARLSPYLGSQQGNLIWSKNFQYNITSSLAISLDGTIYFGASDGKFHALNSDGTEKWSFQTSNITNISCTPAIGPDGTIYFSGTDLKFYALNPDGSKKWSFTNENDNYSTPSIGSDGTIYVGGSNGNLYALNPDGTEKWSYQTYASSQFTSPLAISSDGTIYFGGTFGKFYAINSDGTEKWSFGNGNYNYSSASIGSDGTIYFGSSNNSFYALNTDGSIKWTFVTGNSIQYTYPSIGLYGTIYFGGTDGKFYALNPDGSLKWIFSSAAGNISSSAIGSDGTNYFHINSNSKFNALNPADGSIKWQYNIGFSNFTLPAIGSNGTVYISTNTNMLYAFN